MKHSLKRSSSTDLFLKEADQDGLSRPHAALRSGEPPHIQDIQECRVRPSNPFIEFQEEEVEQSIPQRFAQQVSQYPNRLAIKTKSHQLTYAALNQAANRVARTLLTHCPGKEKPIALLLEHDAPLIAAILGILKAGHIYVPLDPLYPQARINYILHDSQAELVVTDDKHLAVARELSGPTLQLINVDEIDFALAADDFDQPISPEGIAYILYTSGSTGQPKGVVQNHRNALHNTLRYTNGLHICTEDRLTVLHSYCFSAASSSTFAALLNGAALFPYDVKTEGLDGLADWLSREELTIYHSGPTVFHHFVETLHEDTEKFPHLRLIELGGEPISRRDVALYREHFSESCLLHVGLGATEMPNFRQYFLSKQTDFHGDVVPVGYPVPGAEVWLRDENGGEVETNCVGEIVVESQYLSPGYWRKPDLTGAVFTAGPETAGPETADPESGSHRIYHTGDLGYMLPDGCLIPCGRKDFQVKIRGCRIELAEVEMALLDLAGIKEAAVVAREDAPGDKRLVAYVVPARWPAPFHSELRHYLQRKLPDYMMPSAFVLLEALPLTPNGKVDRRALSAPEQAHLVQAHLTQQDAFVAPRTPVEETMSGIWCEVLRVKQVGVHDNFFELGGHSLLATQIISRLRHAFQVEMPLRSLFEAPTVALLAGRMAAMRELVAPPPITAIRRTG